MTVRAEGDRLWSRASTHAFAKERDKGSACRSIKNVIGNDDIGAVFGVLFEKPLRIGIY